MTVSYRIGVAGLGTVGASVVRMIARRRDTLTASGLDIRVAAVSSRDRSRDRGLDLAGVTWFDDPVALARSGEVDCVVELIGGAEGPAKAVVEAALQAGKTVVTANKALLARHGAALAALAEANGVALAYEAAVAGGIPVIKTLREGLPGNAVARVYGILNGTCNYILSRMEREGLTFEACLKDAQALGYAEADPTFDVEGFDTAHKLAILTSLAYGTAIDGRRRLGGGHLPGPAPRPAHGRRARLPDQAARRRPGLGGRDRAARPPDHGAEILGHRPGDGRDQRGHDRRGRGRRADPDRPGAGGEATASAVVADIADVARGIVRPTFGVPAAAMRASERVEMQRHEGGYYIRLTVHDRPGVAAGVAQRMAEREISLESILQRRTEGAGSDPRGRSGRPVPLVLITYAATEGSIRAALDAIGADGLLAEPPQVIRIERE